jgi:HAD superfamily hydrolase (TIGR01509 family)
MVTWFLFDIGNTLIRLAYERVLENICNDAAITRDDLVEMLEEPGGYRDMERGAVKFRDFYDFLGEKAGYRGSLHDLQTIWSDFFDGIVPGMEDLLDRVRDRYRVAFLTNSNEIHCELIPRQFASLFRKEDRFIFSHRFKVAKPDPEIFRRSLELIGAPAPQVVFIDDMLENVHGAQSVGIRSFQFIDAESLTRRLTDEGLL